MPVNNQTLLTVLYYLGTQPYGAPCEGDIPSDIVYDMSISWKGARIFGPLMKIKNYVRKCFCVILIKICICS